MPQDSETLCAFMSWGVLLGIQKPGLVSGWKALAALCGLSCAVSIKGHRPRV